MMQPKAGGGDEVVSFVHTQTAVQYMQSTCVLRSTRQQYLALAYQKHASWQLPQQGAECSTLLESSSLAQESR
jgi:hypothetical protein